MKIEHVEVYGFRAAFRGMRNPIESWEKSDSHFTVVGEPHCQWPTPYGVFRVPESPIIGPEDLALAKRLIWGGSEHRKFLRQIEIWFDITFPRYGWQELDTYKIFPVRNSCSTMNTLGRRNLTQADFELPIPSVVLNRLNRYSEAFRALKKKGNTRGMNKLRRRFKNDLPEGFLQKATYSMNYENALCMHRQRHQHRLPEWNAQYARSMCRFIESLPYMDQFLVA